jgi:hypothetical protein
MIRPIAFAGDHSFFAFFVGVLSSTLLILSFWSFFRGFKALKRLCKLNFTLKRHAEVKKRFTSLLKDYTQLLMENEKAINNLLDFLSGSPDIKEYYDMTLQQLEKNGNKVWLRI